jgi:ATP-dependent helicase/nuclease subunit B
MVDEGPNLPDLGPATAGLTLIEAPGERAEALAIALILREAAETGTRAALISPDRNLTRRVTAALDRWGIRPDDSAGKPLALSAPGRLLRQVAGLFGQRLTVDAALAVIKHPLAFTGDGAEFGRGQHLILSHEYELHVRRHGPVFPTAESLADWAAKSGLAGATRWAAIRGQPRFVGKRASRSPAGRVPVAASGPGRGSGAGLCRNWQRCLVGKGSGHQGA